MTLVVFPLASGCGQPVYNPFSRVVNGEDTVPYSWPWQVRAVADVPCPILDSGLQGMDLWHPVYPRFFFSNICFSSQSPLSQSASKEVFPRQSVTPAWLFKI